MRVVLIGAGDISVAAAGILIRSGHEVVVIETDKTKIDELTDVLDCSFLNGDGSKPEVLREASPETTDILFCLTEDDQDNIIASLVGRSLGYTRVVTSIRDPEFEPICRELGLEDTIIPARTIGRYLADMAGGIDIAELSTLIKDDARMFSFVAGPDESVKIGELALPAAARVICYYREDRFHLAGPDDRLKKGDEVVVLTRKDNLQELRERWEGKTKSE